jgi:thymidylate kinase
VKEAAATPLPRLVVELAGIPGSGKSRRIRTLADRLTERGVAVHLPQAPLAPSVPTPLRLARKCLACATTTLTAPGTTARVVRGLVGSRQSGPGDVAGRAVQWLVAESVARRAARGTGVALVDEGLVQALWSIGLRGDVGPVLSALDASRRAPRADLLVVVRVEPDVALARLAARPSRHSRTQLLDETRRLAELRRGAELLDELVDWWAGRGAGAVLTLDGAADSGDDHARLVDRICAAPGTQYAG